MDLLKALIDEINKYDGSDGASNQLKKLICYMSDREEYRNDPLFKSILFDAAQMMRTFGYISAPNNKINIDDIWRNIGLNDIRQQTIQDFYTSKVYSNNLIDKRQKEIIDLFNSLKIKRLIVSAPTSFGKTFILREIIYLNRENYNNILLVFPTVALLNENTIVINELIKKKNLSYTVVNNVYSKIDTNSRNIFILTPERVLQLLADFEDINIDFFFFDEVYKIDEDFNNEDENEDIEEPIASSEKVKNNNVGRNRAKAFRIALYILSKKIKDYYIAGPYLNLENVKLGFKRYIKANDITMKQIEFEPTLRIEIEAWNKKGIEKDPFKGDIKLAFPYEKGTALTSSNRITALISYLKSNNLGQAIFYCSTPSSSMRYAKNLNSELGRKNTMLEKHGQFIQHLKKRYGIYHPLNGKQIFTSDYWSLINILSSGFGVHHGKFPKYIQREILNIFDDGDLDYLFCTSTIIEGVNTNAKNVVIINTSVGGKAMTAFALKNIRGRAGRYYHHFIGRVFYTDKKQAEIEKISEEQLNFLTYDDKQISNVDLDNADIIDLTKLNKEIKIERETSFNKAMLPDDVFNQSRLYARDLQQGYLEYLITNLEPFEPLRVAPGNIRSFIETNMMSKILNSFSHVGILSEDISQIYSAISGNYSENHFAGLMKYKLKQILKDPEQDVDKAYLVVFQQIRNIIEFEIPQLLSLFESLYKQACILKGYKIDNFDMKSIIRYYGLGVRMIFGTYLVEYGFPTDAIRDIEKTLIELSEMELKESISFVQENEFKLRKVLDPYEINLLNKALKLAD